MGTGCCQILYDIEAIIYFSLRSRLEQIVEILSPLSITYDKIISAFKYNEFIFQNADNHHNDYSLRLFLDILVESGPFGLYFEKYVAELDKLLPITFLVSLCIAYSITNLETFGKRSKDQFVTV